MASLNKMQLIGRLGRDPEVKYSSSGSAVCNVSIAVSSSWKDKTTGEKKEETEWMRVVAYNRLAEIMGEYLKKGKEVYIEGRLKTRKWQDKDTGADRYATEIVADQMQMLGGRDDGGQQAPNQAHQRTAAPANNGYAAASGGGGGISDMDSEIPFAPHCRKIPV